MESVDATETTVTIAAPLVTRIGQFVSIFKLRIGLAISCTALAGLVAATGSGPVSRREPILFVSVLIASAAAAAFNQYFERDLDALMQRTRRRPFATGEFKRGWLWPCFFSVLLMSGVGLAAIAINMTVALFVFLGAFTYGFIYTVWLKKRTSWNIVIGGLAGSFAILAGAAAGPHMGIAVWLLALVLLLWTPPHFWSLAIALRQDYATAGVPMLPVVCGVNTTARVVLISAVALVLATFVPAFYGMGTLYLVAAIVGGSNFLIGSVRLVRYPTPAAAVANFRASLIHLGLLLTGVIVGGALGI